jgi:hypothetical protein
MHRRFGISGVELCDDHHTFPPLFLLALPPVLGPLLRSLLPGHLRQSPDKNITGGDTTATDAARRRRVVRNFQACAQLFKIGGRSSIRPRLLASDGQPPR